MESSILQAIPHDFIRFIVVVLFSLLIGLEQRRQHITLSFESLFGTDRTFTLIGILGYILYIISPKDLVPFLGGGAAIALLLGIFYFQKIKLNQKFGLTTVVIALITYCITPLLYTQPHWLTLLVLICVLIITEIKETLFEFSQKFDNNEFITLAKFLVLAGVMLPLLPVATISADIPVSPYNVGLAIVAVSAISYVSYLLKKFVFPDSGLLLTGILGGLYSSTATTVILAKKSKEDTSVNKVISAIFLSTTMMYVRIYLFAVFFNMPVALGLLPYFIILIVITLFFAFYFAKIKKPGSPSAKKNEKTEPHPNPLEFKTALLFAGLFIFFAIVTTFVENHYGGTGVNIMAFIVGVSDIAPFFLNLFQSKGTIENTVIIIAVLNATTSNNIFKAVYATALSDKSIRKQLIIGFSVLVAAGLIMAFLPPFHIT